MDYRHIQNYYEQLYAEKAGDSFPFDLKRYQAWLPMSGPSPSQKNLRVLDIGCGTGDACGYLSGLGYTCTGIDISQKALGIAAQKNPESTYALSREDGRLNFPDGKFGLIICFGVLEHIIDQALMIKESYRTLDRGGEAIFVVPNAASPYFWFGGTGQVYERPRTYAKWKHMFRSSGFHIKNIRRDPGPSVEPGAGLIKILKININKAISASCLLLSYQLVFVLGKE